MTTTMTTRRLASGRVAVLDDDGRAVMIVDPDTADDLTRADEDDYRWEAEAGFCSICDGLGHGYPGGGPCPLEDRGYGEPEWAI